MGRIALVTERFREVCAFYEALGGRRVGGWDRTGARSAIYDLRGLRLEILDATRERRPLRLGDPGDRLHVVLEVDDVRAFLAGLPFDAPDPETASWTTLHCRLEDPDGIPVTVMQADAPS